MIPLTTTLAHGLVLRVPFTAFALITFWSIETWHSIFARW